MSEDTLLDPDAFSDPLEDDPGPNLLETAGELALARIMRLAALSLLTDELGELLGNGVLRGPEERTHLNALHTGLRALETRAVGDAHVVALLTPDPELRNRITRETLSFYGRSDAMIANLLHPAGNHPGMYRSDVAEELRAQLRAGLVAAGWSAEPVRPATELPTLSAERNTLAGLAACALAREILETLRSELLYLVDSYENDPRILAARPAAEALRGLVALAEARELRERLVWNSLTRKKLGRELMDALELVRTRARAHLSRYRSEISSNPVLDELTRSIDARVRMSAGISLTEPDSGSNTGS